MTLDELEQKLIGWRAARGIDKNSTHEAQMRCYLEELDELCDAIGDMAVCLLNASAMDGRGLAAQHLYQSRLQMCGELASVAGVDFGRCLELAWSEIEHRVGLTRSTGKFTKWDNLTHEERLTVAASGQLVESPKRNQYRLMCTEPEWTEVVKAEADGCLKSTNEGRQNVKS